MHPGNSLLVDYTLTEIPNDNPIYKGGNHWADPSIEHAATLMRQCYDDPAHASALAVVGQAEAREKLSLKAAGQRMAEQLERVPAFASRPTTSQAAAPLIYAVK
jgi:hypothetical protein